MYKFMYWSQTRREELYELVSDPGEQHDLAPTVEPALLDDLRATLRESRAR
jgi:hypothetical protein